MQHLRLVLQNRCQPNFILNAHMLSSSDFPYFNGIHHRLWYGWTSDRNPQLFHCHMTKKKIVLAGAKPINRATFHLPWAFPPPLLLSLATLPSLPSPYPTLPEMLFLNTSTFLPQYMCNVNVGGWRCDALIILQKVFRCGRQSRLLKQSWRWDRLWSEVEILKVETLKDSRQELWSKTSIRWDFLTKFQQFSNS